uniref:EGF-like domain-containing protein n=1 Tax=Meloidogyne incognita TaxID=6306 RepID=A0A914KM06_MELIC
MFLLFICSKSVNLQQQQTQLNSKCLDKFDIGLTRQCMRGEWTEKYYFELSTRKCTLFCSSQNFFNSLIDCQQLCETEKKSCPEKFDDQNKKSELNWLRLTTEANYGGRERINYRGNNHLITATFKNPTTRIISHPHRQHYSPNKQKLINSQLINQNNKKINEKGQHKNYLVEKNQKISKNHASTKPKFLTNLQNKKEPINQKQQLLPNLCDLQLKNPCQNNGTCLWNENTEKYFCKCTEEYFGENCSRQIDFNPCTQSPCLNGATCSVIADAEHVDFDCFCIAGYAGKRCEFRPCDQNPCKNGGICR